jgi:small subunit ribosomal protein S21
MSKKQKQHQQIVPGNSLAINVVGTEAMDLAHALKSWKRKVKSANILNRVKDKQEYIKPSVTNRQQKTKAAYIQRIKSANE